DSMLGRRAGTLGNVRGNAYIVAELKRLGLKPAGDSSGFLQRVPMVSYAVDTARSGLRAGSASLEAFHEYYPSQDSFAAPSRPLDGAQLVYVGAAADSATLPAREALKGKVVVFRSHPQATSLNAPDLGPNARLGLIAGIAFTDLDPVIASY